MPWQKWSISSHIAQMQYCDHINAKEKSTWSRVLSYMHLLNHCPFLSSIYKFLVNFPTCYRQLSTCQFKFTFKWHVPPLVHMRKWVMSASRAPILETPISHGVALLPDGFIDIEL